MTVSTTTTKAIYNGDGSTTAFPTTFEFFDAADIEVIERVITTGAETVKTLSTDYTVSGGNGATGTVTAVTAPASTVQWAIRRKTPLTQQIDYVENDDFPAETHEQGLDRGVMIAQERQEELDRALKFPVSDATSLDPEIPNSVDRAGQFLAFDVSGNPMVAAGTSGVPVSAFMQTLLDDTDATAGRETLGARAAEDAKGADIASAATTDIWATDGNTLHVTGTTTITSFGTAPSAGAWRRVIFDAALTLTDGANLNLPGGANITTAADDFALVYAETTTLFKVLYFKADGSAVAGNLKTGKHTIVVPASAIFPALTNGASALTQKETSTNKVNSRIYAFDDAAEEILWFAFRAPKSADETVAVTVRDLTWEEAAGATAHGIAFGFSMLARGNAEDVDTALGTEIIITDTGAAAGKLYIAPESAAITPGGTWAEGDWLWLKVARKVGDGGDTMDVDAWLHGFDFIFTINAADDA